MKIFTIHPHKYINILRLAHVNEKFGNSVTVANTAVANATTSSFASTSAVVNAVVGNNNAATVIMTKDDEEDEILKVKN